VRVAASPHARGMGVLVVMNEEINGAREVTKVSTMRLQAFHAPDFGLLGHADGDRVSFYRRPVRRCAPDTEFDIRGLDALPRVDIQYAYAGSDGAAVRAFVAAGAKGIVSAGFAPGFPAPPMPRRSMTQSKRASSLCSRPGPAAAAPIPSCGGDRADSYRPTI